MILGVELGLAAALDGGDTRGAVGRASFTHHPAATLPELDGLSRTGTPAIMVNTSSLDAVYSTFVAAGAGVGVGSNVPAGIVCVSAVAVNLRNSIVSNLRPMTPSISGCDDVLTASYSATREAAFGAGNEVVGLLDTEWFVDWPGDLRLSNAGENVFADVAQWQTGDPTTDLDDNARPAVDGTADYAGAARP